MGDIHGYRQPRLLMYAVVSKSPLPFLSGQQHISCAGHFYNPVLVLCIPLLYNKLSNSLSIVTRRLTRLSHC